MVDSDHCVERVDSESLRLNAAPPPDRFAFTRVAGLRLATNDSHPTRRVAGNACSEIWRFAGAQGRRRDDRNVLNRAPYVR